jgi:hypothetical protein
MKKLTTVLLIILVTSVLCYAQDDADENSAIGDKNYFIGFNISAGTSFNTTSMLTDGKREPKLSLALSCRTALYFSNMSGLLLEGGFQYFSAKEKSDPYFKHYEMWYLFVSAAYLMRLKDFMFFFGPYVGFAVAGKYNDAYSSSSSTKKYTLPDIGLSLGFGFIVAKHPKFDLYTGINLKYQLNNFTREASLGSKITAVLLDFTFYFK